MRDITIETKDIGGRLRPVLTFWDDTASERRFFALEELDGYGNVKAWPPGLRTTAEPKLSGY